MSPAAPTHLRFEHRTGEGPVLGIGTAKPRLSWRIPRADAEFEQAAYQLQIVRNDGDAETVMVNSADQVLVPWPSAPLTSRDLATVRVRVRGGDDWSEWSAPASVEAGLFSTEDWTARFVSPAPAGGQHQPAPALGGTIELPDDIVRARLYVTAHGLYTAELNGNRVG